MNDSPSAKLKMLTEQAIMLKDLRTEDPGSMTQFYEGLKFHSPELYYAESQMPKEQFSHLLHIAQMSYSWQKCGRPAYQLTHGLAAALMLTEPPKLAEGERLVLPERTFCMLVPPGVIPVFGPDGQGWADLIWVNQSTNIHAATEKEEEFFRWLVEWRSISVWRDRKPDYINDGDERVYCINPETETPPQKEDDVCLGSALRLIRNFASWMSMTTLPKQRPGKSKPKVVQVGQGVKVAPELRKAATEIALGASKHAREGWKLRSKHVVSGHWKQQAYGPRMSLRKLKWIEPYWRELKGTEGWAEIPGA